MPRKPRQLPAQNTLPYLLLTLTALCGEYPIRQISHLPGGSAYLESVVTALRRDGLLRTFSKDGLRGLRLTSSAKRLLLADAPEWFSAYLTGSSEPNKLKSEIPRRLRLHRMAEILTIMHNADIPAFPWEKAPFSAASQSAAIPAYYTSREVKELGPQGAKIKSSRATGILLTDGGIFLTYNTAKAQMKWEYKAELRFKALLQTEGVMPDAEISGIVFGSSMEQLSILTQPDAHSYFLLDGSFPHFYYLTNDRYGEAILRLLCDTQQRRTLDAILADGLHEGIPNWRVENDAIDSEGNPVLFAYSDKGTYGTAGFMSRKELTEVLDLVPDIRKHSGTILGELDHQVICIPPKTRFNGNLAVYGASGSKKTRAFCVNMILQCAARKSSLVICDPKSELYEKTSEYLRDQGYTVRVFNLVTPSASDSWNCLAEVGGQELMAQLFCDVIIKNTGGEERDHFWDSAEMNLLKALVLYVSTSYPKKKQNIGEVYQLIAASSEQELNALFGVLPVTHPAKAPYSIFKQASEGVRGGVIIGLGSRLQVFQNRDIRNITSYNEIDLELPGKQPCAYYCITSDQDSTFDFLSSLFLSFVFIRLVRYADEHCPGGELPVPVHVLGEELCACGVIPDLSRKISVIRSRNLSMSCVFQNLAGLQNRYPYNQWQEILGNCDVQLFLGCTDALTAEFISDRTGEASISVTSKAKQLGTWRVSNYTPEYRETSGVGRRKLMTMDEVLRMDIDKALILIRGKNVLEVDKYDYSKHPEAKKLRPSKAASHVPAWRANQPQEKQTPSAPPSQAAEKKPAQKKKPAPAEKVVAVTKESIMKKKEDT